MLFILGLFIACGDKEEDTASEEIADTASSEDTAGEESDTGSEEDTAE